MQVNDPNYAGYQLPTVMDPPDSLCFQVKVPNDIGHISAFMGALFELTQWISWQRDPDKRGKDAAAIWRAIWLDLQAQSCDLPKALHGAEIEDFMPLRVDCDCNVYVTCCDGTEKQILTSDQVKALIAGGNVQGAPQPPAGGGQQCYQLKLQANQELLIPVPVSTGDVIEVQSALGAGTDGTASWYCPNGQEFFAGACVGTPFTSGPDPLPTAPHMKLLAHIGSNYYELTVGTPFTVPSGVSLVQPTILVNDSTLSDNSGEYSLNVCVTNNEAATWSSTFNFLLSPGGFAAQFPGVLGEPVWTPGTGWYIQANATGSIFNGQIQLLHDSTNIRHVKWFYTPGGSYSPPAGNAAFYNPAETILINPLVQAGHTFGEYLDAVGVTSTELGWYQGGGGGAGDVTFTSLLVEGTGVKPSQFP